MEHISNKKDYIIFCPYFGNLPSHFPLWLKSCEYNSDFCFVIFTDNAVEKKLPANVLIYQIEFSEFREIIQRKFDFPISLEKPYKLCDYKPTYGYVFSEYISEYKYWGHCDLDLIFGDIKKFIPQNEYDKISRLGHLTIYRNNEEITQCFMNGSELDYSKILSSSMHFGFDEIGEYGVNSLFEKNGYSIYEFEKEIADIYCYHANMSLVTLNNNRFVVSKKNRIFSFEEGHIFEWRDRNSHIEKKEYAYIHFQKRTMKLEDELLNYNNKFLIGPHCFRKYCEVTPNLIKQEKVKKFYPIAIKIKLKAGLHLIKRWFEIKKIERKL